MRTNLTRDFVQKYVIRQPRCLFREKVYLRQRVQFFPDTD